MRIKVWRSHNRFQLPTRRWVWWCDCGDQMTSGSAGYAPTWRVAIAEGQRHWRLAHGS